jgi:uncharacterized membrane protein YozB (DUF420 family)
VLNLFGATVSPIVAFFLLGELSVLIVLVAAFIMARLHKGSTHHYLMLSAFLADILVFKPLMFSRASTVYGSFPWDGTRLAPHFLIAASVAIIGACTVVLGFKYRVKKGSKMFMPPKGKLHRIVGALFLILWSATFAIGLVIFLETYFP